MEKKDDSGRVVLSRIADALGVPVEKFFAEGPRTETMAGADECLRLWFQIKTAEGRRRALKSLRGIVEDDA